MYNDFASFYDELTENADYERRGKFIYKLLSEHGLDSGVLLDLGCGTGTMCEYFSSLGYEPIGVDCSEDMLAVAQEKKYNSGLDIIYLCQNMQELDLFGTIDCAVSTLDCLNHITNENDIKEVFKKTALFMTSGGMFIFDVNTPYKHREILGNSTFVYDFDDVYCVWQNTFDEITNEVEIELNIFESDEEEDDVYYRTDECFTERAYELDDIKLWLEEAKFEVLHIFDDYTRNEITDKTQRAVFVCRLPETGQKIK